MLANGRVDGPTPYDVVERLWREAERERPGADLLQKMTYLELKQRLAELLLMRVDKMTMATRSRRACRSSTTSWSSSRWHCPSG